MLSLYSISRVLYLLVGIVSLIMAVKTLTAKSFLSFHQQAAGKSWEENDPGMRYLLLSLIRISGLGFLITALLLIAFSVIADGSGDWFQQTVIPLAALVFCTGLFIANYRLFRQTGAKTPWFNSLIAMVVLIVAILLESIG